LANDANDIYKADDAVVIETVVYSADFDVNDQVKITAGDMAGQVGYVINKNDAKGIAIVEVEIFNRLSQAEVSYANLEKLSD